MNDAVAAVVREFDDASKYIGVLLVGSEARGEANAFSDIDVVFFAKEEVADERDKYRLVYRDGRLISLSIKQASYLMMGNAEELHKVLAGLSTNKTDNLVRNSQTATAMTCCRPTIEW